MNSFRPRLAFRIATFAALLLACEAVVAHESHGRAPGTAIKAEQKSWGIAGDPRKVNRTITIAMGDDMRFRPDRVEVRRGDTVRFVVMNQGRLMHEMVIGTRRELAEHAAQMLKFPDMAHDEPYMAHVPAGTRQEMVWRFNRAGEFDFACLVAGHYQAGMAGKIRVSARV